MLARQWGDNKSVRLKLAMTPNTQAEHTPAKDDGLYKGRSHYVFNHERDPISQKAFADRDNKIGILFLVYAVQPRMLLTGRRRPHEVGTLQGVSHGVMLVKLEWIMRLSLDIDSDNLKTRTR